jgi:hypothetical protein
MLKIQDAIREGPEKITVSSFILARLWRRVLRETHITTEEFNERMAGHVAHPKLTAKQQSDARASMRATLAKPNVSLRALLEGLRMLKAIRITFTMEVSFQDRPGVTVSDTINFHHPIHNPGPAEKSTLH